MLEGLRDVSSNKLAVTSFAAGVLLGSVGASQEMAYATETNAISARVEQPQMELLPDSNKINTFDRDKYEKLLDESVERSKNLTIRRIGGKLATKTVDGTTYYFDCNRILDGWVTAVQTDPTTPAFNASISSKKMCRDDRISKKEAPKAKTAFRGLLASFMQA